MTFSDPDRPSRNVAAMKAMMLTEQESESLWLAVRHALQDKAWLATLTKADRDGILRSCRKAMRQPRERAPIPVSARELLAQPERAQ
jgi:hypothetical protein